MSKVYFGFALAASMFAGEGSVSFQEFSPADAYTLLEGCKQFGWFM